MVNSNRLVKSNSKSKKGVATLIIGCIILILSLLINRYVEIDDVFCVIIMTFALMIEVYGLYQIVKDTYK